MKKYKHQRRKILNIPLIILLSTLIGAIMFILVYQRMKVSPGTPEMRVIVKSPEKLKAELKIFPTLFITGSSGTPKNNIQHLVKSITADRNNPAKTGLTIIVNTRDKYKVSVSGKVEKENKFPTIIVGMDKGTNDHEIYQYTIKAVMEYLVSHYNIPWYNILGYSSAGGGAMRYLINYSQDKNLPPVKKFIALDGEFNRKGKLKANETMENVYQDGPINKSVDYRYFQDNYKKIDKNIEVALMGLDVPSGAQFDGVLPWSDLFSVYNLFNKNGNKTERFTLSNARGENYSHGTVWKMPKVQHFIEKYFYQ
ncbi:alpha/beta hydrolase [Lactococcus garvieae]|uniref:alpha/beta hydrolase n=1 Tax=Lactococcus garvieae TaxID=1363 RepID=UPI0018D7DB6C|nr:alpha/beta hydrolase [Lactococcus garvieae]QPS71737.1 alpha/beta hydrolase [Lactococcus garvieae]